MMNRLTALLVFTLLTLLVSTGCDSAVGNNNGSGGNNDSEATSADRTDATPAANAKPAATTKKQSAGDVTSSVDGPSWEMSDADQTHNFGKVWAGETLRHTFEFKNVGSETLRVLEAKPRCSCSVADNYSKVIEPGEIGRIPFVLKTTNKHGPVHEYLKIKLNDPKKPLMTINMRGEVKRVAKVTVTFDSRTDPSDRAAMTSVAQRKAFFGAVKANEEVSRILLIRNTSGSSPLKLDLENIVGNAFVGELKEKIPGEAWEFYLFSRPPYNVGYNFTQFRFRTNIPEEPVWEIKASLELPPRVKVIPNRIVADANTYKNKKRDIRIQNNGDVPIQITSVACSDPNYKVTYLGADPKDAKTMIVEVLLPPGEYRPPAYGEVVRIETDDPEKSVIELMVLPELSRGATARPADKPLEFYPGKLLG